MQGTPGQARDGETHRTLLRIDDHPDQVGGLQVLTCQWRHGELRMLRFKKHGRRSTLDGAELGAVGRSGLTNAVAHGSTAFMTEAGSEKNTLVLWLGILSAQTRPS